MEAHNRPIQAPSKPSPSRLPHFKAFLSPHKLGLFLDRHGFGTEILGLIGTPFVACSKTAIFWHIYEEAVKTNFVIAINEIGIRGSELKVIIAPDGKSADYWRNIVASHPLLKLCEKITFVSFPTGSSNIDDSGTHPGHIQAEQFILDTAPIKRESLSSNTKRNIKKAAKSCAICVLPPDEAISKYIEMVNYSDERRAAQGIKNAKHQHQAVKTAIKSGYSRLYFAHYGETIASAVLIGIIHDRAYYLMGGTSPDGMSIGAAPFLLFRVAEQLEKEGVKSLTLGLANRESLKRFKYGLGARSLVVQQTFLNQYAPLGSRAIHFLLKSSLTLYGLIYRLTKRNRHRQFSA